MPLIKRYPNRKLYNTETKQYITLAEIAELIRHGSEVRIIDHSSGEDLTTLTLTQIILEEEKKRSGFLPHSILSGLIQTGGAQLQILHQALKPTSDTWRQADELIRARISSLVEESELTKVEAERLLKKLITSGGWTPRHEAEEISLDDLQRYLEEYQIATREDIQRLHEMIDAIVIKVDS